MALHFHPLIVKDVQKETADAVCVTFDIPDTLKSEFAFKHGQNITVRKIINGEEIRRTYSICSSPLDNELKIGIKQAFSGIFSTYANARIKVGDRLEVMPPTGTFNTELHPSDTKNYVAFAAGSGITPVLSIIKTTLAIETGSAFTLVYGNKNHLSIMFKEELCALKNRFMDRFSLHHVLSRERTESAINYGRINEQKCISLKRLIRIGSADEFFICGPEEMIFCVKRFLENEGVDNRKIHFELFTTPKRQNKAIFNPGVPEGMAESSRVVVKLDGRSFEFTMDYNNNSILDAALAEGADLPYACKGGVCTTCRAKLTEGNVEMEANYGLEPDEVDAGFILTCQAHPRSSLIVVDYD